MPTPFPGMDPYLEHPAGWQGLHTSLIAALRISLSRLLPPHYFIGIEEHVYLAVLEEPLVGRPDLLVRDRRAEYARPSPAGGGLAVEVPLPEEIHERYLEIRDAPSGEVVTVLELLSYSNKKPGRDRESYERKRMGVLGSLTHLVEIDLLRTGKPMPVLGSVPPSDYRILVSRADRRPRAELFPFGLRDPIPKFVLPLRPGDSEPEVDLGAVLHALYVDARFHLRVNYRADAVPPLAEADRGWAHELLQGAGLR